MNLPSVIPWWAKALGGVAVACAIAYACWHAYDKVTSAYYNAGVAVGDAKVAALQAQVGQANLKATAAARAAENAQADALTQVATSYERGKTDAQADSDAVIAGLRAGNLKLRDYWTDTSARSVSAPGATVAGVDDAERRREESAGRAIGAAEQCVAQVAGLQQVIRTYLRIINGPKTAPQ